MFSLDTVRNFRGATSKFEKVAIAVPVAMQLQGWSREAYKKYKEKRRPDNFSLKIALDSWFYPTLAEWMAQFSETNIRDFEISSEEEFVVAAEGDDDFDSDGTYTYKLRFLFGEEGNFKFSLNGYNFVASYDTPESPKSTAEEVSNIKELLGSFNSKYFYVSCNSMAGIEYLKEEIKRLHYQKAEKKAKIEGTKSRFFITHPTMGWRFTNREKRPISSVILQGDLLERIQDDLKKFIADEDKYYTKGIPYRRGYLLFGPPGTGKSSIFKALASELNRNLYYLSLKDIKDDSELFSLVSNIGTNGILLLEDVDVYAQAQDRLDAHQGAGITLSALLNVLDGPASPDGLITFMSTNYRDRLDPALTRKGRVDFQAEVGLPDEDQISRLWGVFFDSEFPSDLYGNLPVGKTTAFYYDIFKTHMDSPEDAYKALWTSRLDIAE